MKYTSAFINYFSRLAPCLGHDGTFRAGISQPSDSYGICDRAGLPLLEETLKDHPDLILFGHSQVFWLEISADCPKEGNQARSAMGRSPVIPGRVEELMDRYPNLCGDLSAYSGSMAILRDEEYGLYFLEKFQDRLCYATDTMNRYQVFPLGEFLDKAVETGRLSRAAYEKITYGNAQRIFKLE